MDSEVKVARTAASPLAMAVAPDAAPICTTAAGAWLPKAAPPLISGANRHHLAQDSAALPRIRGFAAEGLAVTWHGRWAFALKEGRDDTPAVPAGDRDIPKAVARASLHLPSSLTATLTTGVTLARRSCFPQDQLKVAQLLP